MILAGVSASAFFQAFISFPAIGNGYLRTVFRQPPVANTPNTLTMSGRTELNVSDHIPFGTNKYKNLFRPNYLTELLHNI
jgi:hypothetical protein